MKKQFRDFESAREFVRALNLKGEKEWQEYCKSGNKPDDIPITPRTVYKKDFKGMWDWLGNGKTKEFRPFKEAREFVRALNLKGEKEWQEYCKSGNKPDNIPRNPRTVYKNDFKGTRNWLKNESLPFEDAKLFIHSLDLKNKNKWKEYCKSGNKPDNIPDKSYKQFTQMNGLYNGETFLERWKYCTKK